MPQKLTFMVLAEKLLREEKRPLSPAEMWKIAEAKGYNKDLETEGKTPWSSLYTTVFLNTRDAAETIFYKTGARPARYFLKDLRDSVEPEKIEKAVQEPDSSAESLFDYNEEDLHPFLTYYAHTHFGAYTKTISHHTARKKEFGEWVHPDMIGVYFPAKDWKPEVLDLSVATGNTALKIYSFELKKALSFGNLRQAFFQAVSNSSWANGERGQALTLSLLWKGVVDSWGKGKGVSHR
jgi:hypothetical protein